jgi:hypothetical protein
LGSFPSSANSPRSRARRRSLATRLAMLFRAAAKEVIGSPRNHMDTVNSTDECVGAIHRATGTRVGRRPRRRSP